MKSLSKFVPYIHFIVAFFALLSIHTAWEEHTVNLEQLTSQIPILEGNITSGKQKLRDIAEFKKDLEASQERIKEIFKNIERVQKQLPTDINDIEMYDFFSKEKKTLSIPELDPVALQDTVKGFYVTKGYELKGSSTFLQFLILLERLSGVERLFNIKSLKLELPDENQKGRFQMVKFNLTLETFKYNPNYQEPPPADNTTTPTVTPGTQP